MLLKSLYSRIAPVRHLVNAGLATQSRLYTSNSPELEIVKDALKKDFVILKLDRPPVNSLNLDVVKDLGYQIDIFEQNPDLKGVIIASVNKLTTNSLAYKQRFQFTVLPKFKGPSRRVLGRPGHNGAVPSRARAAKVALGRRAELVGETLRKSEDLHCRSQRPLTSLGLPDLDGLRLPDHGVRGQLPHRTNEQPARHRAVQLDHGHDDQHDRA